MGWWRTIVLVTDKQFYLDKGLKQKMDLIIDRITKPNPKKDALMLVEGGEGEGKTNLAFQLAYYASHETGRVFNNERIFFKADKLLEFARETENQIIVYDEPSLDMLSTEWWKEEQSNIVKLLMTARKKRHLIFFNITKFYKFNEYIVVDRAICLIHVYSQNEIEPGKFVYIKKRSIEYLFNSYKSSKKRKYKEYTSIRGNFRDYVPGIIDYEQYENDKDEAILSIGTKKNSVHHQELKKFKGIVGRLKCPINSRQELADLIGVDTRSLQRWAKNYQEAEE